MFAKLLMIIVVAGCIALALLGLRQQRLMIVHDMVDTHRTLMEQRRMLWTTRQRIAEACRTPEIQAWLAEDQNRWLAIHQPWTVVPTDMQAQP
ncbi:MAG: hypothetical protein P8I74_03525 [Phycisphaerales bacterium]|nr:hypothetical protein [Phycisphaerales bacterium]